MIWGLEQPQIKNGIDTITLDYAELRPDFMMPIILEYRSPFNGEMNFIYLGDYAHFRVQINLFEITNRSGFFNQLKSLEKQIVVFYPHKDGEAIKDRFGNDVIFFVSTVKPFYLENENEFDIMEITFNSVGYVDYTGIYNILGFGYQFAYNFGYGI
ncbi:MAG: hypothetical protein AB1633_00200 [Elusimicrobiota bacterium]